MDSRFTKPPVLPADDRKEQVLAVQAAIIIPTLNEAQSIRALLSSLVELYPGIRIIIADDASSDGTQQLVREFAISLKADAAEPGDARRDHVKLLARNDALVKGLTASVLDALRQCETEYFVVMDGDFQHPPACAAQILRMLQEGADIVVGCRDFREINQPLFRYLLSCTAASLAGTILKIWRQQTIKDPLSGFFGGRTCVVLPIIQAKEKLFELRGYKVLFDLLRLLPAETRIEQIFYDFGARPSGSSKFKLRHALLFLRSLLR